jgi:hypothetical protein
VESCECRLLYELINKRIVEAFAGFTLEDLRNPSWHDRLARELGKPAGTGTGAT